MPEVEEMSVSVRWRPPSGYWLEPPWQEFVDFVDGVGAHLFFLSDLALRSAQTLRPASLIVFSAGLRIV